MKKIEFYLKTRFDSFFLLTSIAVVITVLVSSFLALQNNVVFSDEGWYLYLLRDLPKIDGTRYHLLFKNVFHNNIYAIRVANWLIQLMTSMVFAIGLVALIKNSFPNSKKWLLFLFSFCTLYWGQAWIDACPSFNYYNLNSSIVRLSMGFLFIGLQKERDMLWMALSGFFIGFLFPVMITNAVIIPIIMVVIGIFSRQVWKSMIWFVGGMVLFAVYYLVFVESFEEVVSFLLSGTRSAVKKGSYSYGLKYLLLWLKDAGLYLIKILLESLTFYFLYVVIIRRNKQKRMELVILYFVVCVCFLLYSWSFLPPTLPLQRGYIVYFAKELLWIYLFCVLISEIEKKRFSRKEASITILLILTVVFLCFGTNNEFHRRACYYYSFVCPLLIYFSSRKSMLWKMVCFMVLFANFVVFLIGLGGKTWHREKYFGNHIPVSTIDISQKVRVEERYIYELQECRDRIPQGQIMNDFENWGLVALLGYHPVSSDFEVAFNDLEDFQRIVDDVVKEEGELWVVTSKWTNNLIEKINLVQGYIIKMDTVENNIYIHITPDVYSCE